jgi:hypothetical protein
MVNKCTQNSDGKPVRKRTLGRSGGGDTVQLIFEKYVCCNDRNRLR